MDGSDVIEDPGIPDAKMVNVVCQFRLEREKKDGTVDSAPLNLERLSLMSKQRGGIPMKYNPSRFAAATIACQMRCFDITASVLLFASGNAVLGGANTEERSRLMTLMFTAEMTRVYRIPFIMRMFSIANLVCHMDAGFSLDLHRMDSSLGMKSRYNPTGRRSFPACRVHPHGKKSEGSVYLFYQEGPIVITGANNRKKLHEDHVRAFEIALANKKDTLRGIAQKVAMDRVHSMVEHRMNAQSSESAGALGSSMRTVAEGIGKRYMRKTGVAYKRPAFFDYEKGEGSTDELVKIPGVFVDKHSRKKSRIVRPIHYCVPDHNIVPFVPMSPDDDDESDNDGDAFEERWVQTEGKMKMKMKTKTKTKTKRKRKRRDKT